MRNIGRQLALLALSGVLLVNLGLNATAELVKQAEVDSPSLPALVASDDSESPASTSSTPSQTTISDTTVASLPTTSATVAAASSSEPTAGPQEDKESSSSSSSSSSTPIKAAGQDEAQQVSGSDKSSQPAKEPSVVPEAPAKEDSATESSQPKLPPASPAAEETSTGEKDIRVLLANKNDAENDLNSPPVEKDKFSPSGPTLIVVTSTDKKEPAADLDAPVDVNSGTGESQAKPQVESFDNRFHYSLAGNSDKPLSGSDSGDQATTTSSTTTEKPSLKQDEAAKKDQVDEEAPISEKPVEQETPAKKEAEQPAKEKTEPPKEANSPDDLTGKRADSGEKVEPVAVKPAPEGKPEQSPANRLSPSEEGDNQSSEASTTAAPTTSSPPQESSTGAPTTQSSNAESSTTEKTKEPTSEQVKPVVVASNPPVVSEEPAKSGESELKNKTQASPELKKPEESEKPISVPSILATALGTALGGAVNPLYKNLGGKEKPLIANRNLTTTKAPAASSTTRKSSTDRWDRWSPSSPAAPTTGSPPTRLRPLPILPSIRRRFRPYNRFSPFPFGGPDSYSPSEGELTPPVLGSGGGRFPGGLPATSTSTSRPKRRRTSTTGPTKPASEDEADEEVSLKPQDTSGSRRRGQGSNRRRQHNHNHSHNHHHHHPHQAPNQGESEFGGRRHHHKQHGTRNFERDEPFGSDGISPGGSPFGDHGNPHRHGPRPISPGFSLFNSGATGSGFDLLNPFSGWLDDAIRPARRPPVSQAGAGSTLGSPGRRPGSQPVPVGGDYNDEQAPPEHDNHHHHHRHNQHDHHSRPHNGRDDYHDHHHDCDHHHEHDHDHDHDHEHEHDHHHEHHHREREPYRPIRPQREPVRPPIGGDFDPYPSSASFGRRPSRPYNRRDQAEIENKEQNQAGGSAEQASPGLYASIAPVAPRRVPSIFSPFDSLFGSLDDDLFSLRSSFIDTPAKEASHAFDTILTSPKISMPGGADSAAHSVAKEGDDKSVSSSSNNNNNNNKDAPAIKPTGEQEANNNNNNNDLARRGSVVIPKRQ